MKHIYCYILLFTLFINTVSQENNIDNLDDINVEKDLKQQVEFLIQEIKKKDKQYKNVLRKLKEQERKIQNYEQYVDGLKKEIESIRERMDEIEEDDQYQEIQNEIEYLVEEKIDVIVNEKVSSILKKIMDKNGLFFKYDGQNENQNDYSIKEDNILIIITNEENPIQNIFLTYLQQIYLGHILYFDNNEPILCMGFTEESTERKSFSQIVFQKTSQPMITYWSQSKNNKNSVSLPTIAKNGEEMMELVQEHKGAIGYIRLSDYLLLKKQSNYKVKMLSVDNIMPSIESANSNKYSLVLY